MGWGRPWYSSVTIGNVQAENQTENRPNMSGGCYRCTNPLGPLFPYVNINCFTRISVATLCHQRTPRCLPSVSWVCHSCDSITGATMWAYSFRCCRARCCLCSLTPSARQSSPSWMPIFRVEWREIFRFAWQETRGGVHRCTRPSRMWTVWWKDRRWRRDIDVVFPLERTIIDFSLCSQ
jgi:hypothetical protein